MNTHHHRFEMQCLMASCGQLSGRRLEQLREHAAACDACRGHLCEMAELNLHLLSAMPEQRGGMRMTRDMTERFVARAIREGVPLTDRAGLRRPMRFAFAVTMMIVLATVTATVARHIDGRMSPEILRESATQAATGSASLLRERRKDTSRPLHRSTARRTIARESLAPGGSQHELPEGGRSHVASWFPAAYGHAGVMNSAEMAAGRKVNVPIEMAPAHTAWLARQNAASAWSSFTPRKNCDSRDESSSGNQPWSSWERNNAPGPPVFCFDPRIALVADSNFPESLRLRWNRPGELESLPPFLLNASSPAIIH